MMIMVILIIDIKCSKHYLEYEIILIVTIRGEVSSMSQNELNSIHFILLYVS